MRATLALKKSMCFTSKSFDLIVSILNPLSANPHKMVKYTQAIRLQEPTNCLNVFKIFVALALKGLKT